MRSEQFLRPGKESEFPRKGGGGTTVLAISYADHTLEGRAKNKEQMLLLQLKRNVWICKSDGIEKF